jgi:hypothetical protein
VGQVLSAWQHDGRLDIVMDVDERNLESALINEFVRNGKCKELSLGYKVCMSAGEDGLLQSTGIKDIMEVSIVLKGAREDCYIRGWSL